MSLSLRLMIATMQPDTGRPPGEISSWVTNYAGIHMPLQIQYNTQENNLGVVGSYDKLYRESIGDILVYAHDDVTMREENWNGRIVDEFTRHPECGVIGFGGAIRHGSADLYKTPYKLQQLGRSGYLSNVDDAEVHGERFTGSREVAVIDGFVVAVRRELLHRGDGWASICSGCDFFCYDYAVCAWARRLGCTTRMVGIRCHHHGGRTSVKVKDNPITGQKAYDDSHRWFYDEFRDVMPFSCESRC